MPTRLRRIATLGIQMFGHDADLLRGILSYAREKPQWVVYDTPHGLDSAIAHHEPPHGVIGHIPDQGLQNYLAAMQIPVVNTYGTLAGVDLFPRVSLDNDAIGRMAADHLASRGFQQCGYFNPLVQFEFMRERGESFCGELERRGVNCDIQAFSLDMPAYAPSARVTPQYEPIAEWLRAVPKPFGVFACMDRAGRLLCWISRQCQLRVPEDVAVVGTDDFDLVCETSVPPLSSVQVPGEAIGYHAALTLDRMMTKHKVEHETLFPPVGVHVRQSSDVVAVQDSLVSHAVVFMRQNYERRVNIADVARHMQVDRRLLERRFTTTLGRTPLQELHRIMVRRAAELLRQTALPVDAVARQSGFRDSTHLGRAFLKLRNQSPGAFRQRQRAKP